MPFVCVVSARDSMHMEGFALVARSAYSLSLGRAAQCSDDSLVLSAKVLSWQGKSVLLATQLENYSGLDCVQA